MINKKQYSLLFVQSVEQMNKNVKKFVEENSDILELTIKNPMELLIEDKSELSDFSFLIHSPQQDNRNKILFKAEHKPHNSVILAKKAIVSEEKSILDALDQWTKLIRSYNNTSWTTDESILNEYEREFYEGFQLIEEDADIKPFDLERQTIIHNYLVETIKILERNKEDNKDLINEANEIKDKIPKMTQKTTVRKMSRFFANVRGKSLTLLKELFETGKKELFKRAVNFALDSATDLLGLM